MTESAGKDFKLLPSAPGTATAGVLGQRAMLSTTGETYVCTSALAGNYTWEKLAKNSDVETLSQSMGGLSFSVVNGNLRITY